MESPIEISYESIHNDQTNINVIVDKRVTFVEDAQDIDERVDLAIDHLNQSDSDDEEYSSGTTATDDDNSTYIPSNNSNSDGPNIDETTNHGDTNEVNSEDFTFNIHKCI